MSSSDKVKHLTAKVLGINLHHSPARHTDPVTRGESIVSQYTSVLTVI